MEKRRSEEEWQKPHVERVLTHHNASHGTNLVVVGRYESVYGCPQTGKRWDWVCRDAVTHVEAAIEVKQLIRSDLEERHFIVSKRIGQSLKKRLTGKLSGTFVLHSTIPEEQLQLKYSEKKELVECLEREITLRAPTLQVGESYDLATQFVVGSRPTCFLLKTHDSGSKLDLSGSIAFWNVLVAGERLREVLQSIFRGANSQLAAAKSEGIQHTLLVIIERSLGESDTDEIRRALCRLPLDSVTSIDSCYLVKPASAALEVVLPSREERHQDN